MLTSAQIRMAKAALQWSNTDLSRETGLHKNTLNRAENGVATRATLALIKATFEAAGVEFTNGDAPGVRLRARDGAKG